MTMNMDTGTGIDPDRRRVASNLWKGTLNIVYALLPFAVVIVALELIIRGGVLSGRYLPLPSTIWSEFQRLAFERGILWEHLQASLGRFLLGYLLAMAIGLSAGALLGQSVLLEEMFSPILTLLIAIPTIAWVPVLLITMGLGEETIITAIFLGGFFAITYNTMAGMRTVDRSLINVGRNLGLSRVRQFVEIYLPGSFVAILAGLRLGIGYSWRALVGAEMLAAMIDRGIGKMIYDARFWNEVTVMFVGLIMIGLVGFLFDKILIGALERATVEKWGMVREE